MRAILRQLVRYAAAAGLILAVFLGAGRMLRPDVRRPPEPVDPEEVARVTARRDVSLNREAPPTAWREVDYAEGEAATWWPQGEPSMLADLVRDGRLPPVAERVGPEPLVLEGPEGVGRHGGTWFRIASSEGDVGIVGWRIGGARLVMWSTEGYPIVPWVARGWEASEDRREWTFFLRRGMRWSDGHPFTAGDILFWWVEDVNRLGTPPAWMRGGDIERVDDHTIRFVFEEPMPLLLTHLAGTHDFAIPEHYFRPYHPELGDPELLARTREALRLASDRAVYGRMRSLFNPEAPRLWPWIYRAHTGTPPYTFVRNPYFFAVDTEGNQLPYLDRVQKEVRPQNLIGISAAQGQVTFQLRHLRFEDYTLLMDGRDDGHYEVLHWYQATRSPLTVFPNLNRRIDPARPETAAKHELLNRREFRQALSLALNRKAIIRAEYSGQGEPAQIDPGPDSPHHHPRLYRAFTEHDPARASALLDGLGLTRRDGEGMRMFPDGRRMTFFLHATDYTGSGPVQLLLDDWAAVGVRVILRDQARTLWQAQQSAFDHDFSLWTGESEFDPLVEWRSFAPRGLHSFHAPGFGIWYNLGGHLGDERAAERPQAIEPPPDHPARRAIDLIEAARAEVDDERRADLIRELLDLAADELWHISITTPPPQLAVVSRDLRNVPEVALTGAAYSTPANAAPETWWHENPADSPGAIRRLQESILTPVLAPRMQEEPPARAGRLLVWLFTAVGLAFLALMALRHPFVGRRLAIMVPTLGIISVIVFTIIQLPPGDFLTARILELEAQGDEGSIRAVEDLRQLFHTDETVVMRYVRWMGFPWFLSFESADRGLLQGHLGRSMEDGRLVNDIIGDRLLLTFLISLFSILFTWAFALPSGIYSAVKQYSVGDYLLTLLGFIGMCIPSFLLALILIHLGRVWFGVSISGLFSPEFAAQPEWDWPKVKDLLQHIWVPVVVLGVGGTAGMIRVMRANLLDELRKPYVVTARAKGVRPVKLLLKYPVRIALNPFLSGIGGIFPTLISGGAIVAMVLSLPTVGPLMLSALMAQDMYLAGSMLMLLSTLGVLGTLISDLLLLAVDPRIRMGDSKA